MSLDGKALISLVKKNPLLAGCAVIGLGLLVTIYFRSGLGEERKTELDQKQTEGRRYHANLTNSAQLTEDLQVLVEANRIVRDRAINPADLAKNLQYFYRIEAETGVKYTDLRQVGVVAGGKATPAAGAKPSAASSYVPINYTVSVSGDFPAMINFLRSLERGGHFCRLNGMVASLTASSVTINLNVDLLGQP